MLQKNYMEQVVHTYFTILLEFGSQISLLLLTRLLIKVLKFDMISLRKREI